MRTYRYYKFSEEVGTAISRKNIELSTDDIQQIAATYHNWKQDNGYEDILGFCKSTDVDDVAALGYVLTPGRYIGIPDDDDDDDEFDFDERVRTLTKELMEQMEESALLDEVIRSNLAKLEVPKDE